MNRSGKFRKVSFYMKRGNGYGQYEIVAENYRGRRIVVHTTNSEAWDYINDDSNREKHMDALRHCYYAIRYAYEDL